MRRKSIWMRNDECDAKLSDYFSCEALVGFFGFEAKITKVEVKRQKGDFSHVSHQSATAKNLKRNKREVEVEMK